VKISEIIGRKPTLFLNDVVGHEAEIEASIRGKRFLVYGGAGSIGKEVVGQIFLRQPDALHVIDISENNLVELVRDLRSSKGYISGDSRFLPLDMGSAETAAFLHSQPAYDYVLNLAAMKHVRSEKDEYSLMRMIDVNVLNTLQSLDSAVREGTSKYFAVSTDKAKYPANLMGATKRIMEDILFSTSDGTSVSTARFANVAFSDGSLLHGFTQRILRRQPISAPRDVRRYFVTGEESGLLCLASTILGSEREIFFPKLDANSDLLTFSEIAMRFVRANGYEPHEVADEEEARAAAEQLITSGKWPCYFFESDTSGEKPFEEFYSSDDAVDWDRFEDIGVIASSSPSQADRKRVDHFVDAVRSLRSSGKWTKPELVTLISDACPELNHVDTGKFLDEKM
jgi:FlaA1/EpsC-like NDP-sugar epimerase